MVWVYAVGALDGDELRQFEEHLIGCSECQQELKRATQTADRLPYAAPPAQPPPELASKVERRIAAIAGNAQQSTTTRISPMTFIGFAAAAVLLVTSLFIWQRFTDSQNQFAALQERLQRVEEELKSERRELALYQSPHLSILALAGQDQATNASGRVLWDTASGEGYFLASSLPAIASDKSYQLWVIADGKPVSAGVFAVDQQGIAKIPLQGIPSKDSIGAFAVTVEPAGGLPQPSGPMYLLGALTKS